GAVVRRFLRDCDVMRMTLPNARRRDLYELRFRSQFFDRLCAAVAHPGPQSTDELIDVTAERPLEGNAPFDSSRHQLARASFGAALPISFAGAFHHGAKRTH